MSEFLQQLANVITLFFVLSTMISMGLGLTVGEIVRPLKNIRFLVVSLGVNFIIAPGMVYLMTLAFSLNDPLKNGLVLVGLAAGAPALPKLAQIAKTDVAVAVSLMVLLIVVTIVFIPLLLPVVLEGVEVGFWDVARGLILQMLLPLALALVVRAFFKDLADALRPFMTHASSITLLLLIVITIAVNFENVVSLFGSGGLLASLIVVIVTFGTGYLLGGTGSGTRRIQALGASQRNIADAMVVALQNFGDQPDVLVMIVTFSVLTLIIVAPAASIFGRR